MTGSSTRRGDPTRTAAGPTPGSPDWKRGEREEEPGQVNPMLGDVPAQTSTSWTGWAGRAGSSTPTDQAMQSPGRPHPSTLSTEAKQPAWTSAQSLGALAVQSWAQSCASPRVSAGAAGRR